MTMLEEIARARREDVRRALQERGMDDAISDAQSARPLRDFGAALRGEGLAVIAEFKRRAPSAGELSSDADPADRARRYQEGGADALSVLVEGRYFGGSLEDVRMAHEACELPVLCKDFVVHPYQIYSARAAGADAILLIVSLLSRSELEEYIGIACRLGMEALVEVHAEEELERALEAGAGIIGINNRDLRTFSVDVKISLRLARLVPGGRLVVAESGISSTEDLLRLQDAGIDAVLVGTALMRSDAPEALLRGWKEVLNAGKG